MAKFAIKEISPAEYPEWDSFVKTALGGSIYQSAIYHNSLAEITGGRSQFIAVMSGDRIAAGVPLLIYRSRAGQFVNNRLFLHYNGIMAAKKYALAEEQQPPAGIEGERLELMAALAGAIDQRKLGSVTLHQCGAGFDFRPFHQRGWRSAPTYTFTVALNPQAGSDISAVLARADKNIRRLVRKAAENGVTFSGEPDSAGLYDLHLQTAERKGAPVYLPREQFTALLSRLHAAGICRIYQARLTDGTLAAAQLVLVGPGGDSHTVCAAADPRFQSIGVNPFLRFGAFERLQAEGVGSNDLTNASVDSVGKFKADLGAKLQLNSVLNAPLAPLFRLNRLRSQIGGWLRGLKDTASSAGAGSQPASGSAASRPEK